MYNYLICLLLKILTIAGISLVFMTQAGVYSVYISEAQGAAVDVFAIFDENQSTNDIARDDRKNLLSKASFDSIKFAHVTFAYPSRPGIYALDDVSFTINRGETVALVGHSGSGKSSCIQLLTRFYEVTTGEILLDDVNIADYDCEWLRQHIAIISQDTVSKDDTVLLYISILVNVFYYHFR